MNKLDFALMEIKDEYYKACDMHPRPFTSNHEGYGIIKEEFAELWDEIRAMEPQSKSGALRKEALHLAAMALRFIVDRC